MPSDGKSLFFCPSAFIQHPNDSSADDVLKARLKTVGVSEYRFEMEAAAGRESGTEWRIIDVGGSRSQVRVVSHCSYFDILTYHFLYSAVSSPIVWATCTL